MIDETVSKIFSNPNVLISTSLDGNASTHRKNRTKTPNKTDAFFTNLDSVIQQYGNDKISALPTIDYHDPPSPEEIVESYTQYGIYSIFLRPVNYVGFARKQFSFTKEDAESWIAYHRSFIDYIIGYNVKNPEAQVDEYYFTLCLRRIMKSYHHSHVDLRNPNYMGQDYLLVDYDGRLYPTDEARMITRTGQIDLCVGGIKGGLNAEQLSILNADSFNNVDPDCLHCVYQPYCGKDVVDDLSRYGRIDGPRQCTYFCKTQMAIFDLAFEFLISADPDIMDSVSRWLDIPMRHGGLIQFHDTS